MRFLDGFLWFSMICQGFYDCFARVSNMILPKGSHGAFHGFQWWFWWISTCSLNVWRSSYLCIVQFFLHLKILSRTVKRLLFGWFDIPATIKKIRFGSYNTFVVHACI